jgi:hypothetical protein
MKNCNESAIKEIDDQTLQGIIIVEDCPCEARYSNNASRIAAVSAEVTTQLNSYMKQTHGSQSNYRCTVQLVSGNGTKTVFHYACTVPKADHDKAKVGMQQCCTNDQIKKTIEQASLLQTGDEDSTSSENNDEVVTKITMKETPPYAKITGRTAATKKTAEQSSRKVTAGNIVEPDVQSSKKPNEQNQRESTPKPDEHKDGESFKKPEEQNKGASTGKPDEHKEGESSKKPNEQNKGESTPKPDEHKEGESSKKPEEQNNGESTSKPDEHKESESSTKPEQKNK